MYFYCTTQVEDYFKVGISRSYTGIKNRLTDYRSIYPWTKILFFTEVYSAEELERTFKNKFVDFRIGRSECYKLRPDIIFNHVLKFLHRERRRQIISRKGEVLREITIKNKELFGFWRFSSSFHLSSYYFKEPLGFLDYKTKNFNYENARRNKEPYGHSFGEKSRYFDIIRDYIPVCTISRETIKTDKDGRAIKYKIILKYPDFSSKDKFINFKKNFNEYFETYINVNTRSQQIDAQKKFKEENFKKKKVFLEDEDAQSFLEKKIYDSINKIHPNLLKGYTLYREHSTFGIPRLPFYSRAHTQLKYSRKTKSTFKNNVDIDRYFNNYFHKIMHYPKDKFLEHLKYYMDISPGGHLIDISIQDEKKAELMKRIIRIIKAHHRNAHEYIGKAYDEYLSKNEK
jgi:hypothetical protein